MSRMSWASLLLTLIVLSNAVPAEAVEYRLQVVNLNEEAFAYYVDGFGRPLNRLESGLDRQEIPRSTLLFDRSVLPARASLAEAFEATPVRIEPLISDDRAWLEYRWEGKPGIRSVWMVETRSLNRHEVRQVGLKGTGPFRHVIPYSAAIRARPSPAVSFPVDLIDFWNGRPGLWAKWLARYLDLTDGLAAVVGVEPYPDRPDRVYLVIEQPAGPTIFKAVLAWRKREGAFKNLFEGATGGPGASR